MTDTIEKNGLHPSVPGSQEDEWVTVTEAASRLGLHPRQARRYADRLQGTEDRTPEGLSPIRCRLSALLSFLPGRPEKEETGKGQGQDTGGQSRPKAVSEVEFLREQLQVKDTQIAELHRLMLADKQELVELRQRNALPPAAEPELAAPQKRTPWWAWWKRRNT